jgi:hypothetical protein
MYDEPLTVYRAVSPAADAFTWLAGFAEGKPGIVGAGSQARLHFMVDSIVMVSTRKSSVFPFLNLFSGK